MLCGMKLPNHPIGHVFINYSRHHSVTQDSTSNNKIIISMIVIIEIEVIKLSAETTVKNIKVDFHILIPTYKVESNK